LVKMAQAYLNDHATVKYMENEGAARNMVPIPVHAVYNEDAGAAFHEKKQKVADCIADMFKKYKGLRELISDLTGAYGDLRMRVLNMALAHYSGTIAVA